MTAILDTKTNRELYDSLLAEAAKSSNELRCAKQDLAKVESRLSFILVLINEMKWREDERDYLKGDL